VIPVSRIGLSVGGRMNLLGHETLPPLLHRWQLSAAPPVAAQWVSAVPVQGFIGRKGATVSALPVGVILGLALPERVKTHGCTGC
jgi:hypothetical protein